MNKLILGNRVFIAGKDYELVMLDGMLTTRRGGMEGQYSIEAVQGEHRFKIKLSNE